jgi:soluble lytic murein transglycosylase
MKRKRRTKRAIGILVFMLLLVGIAAGYWWRTGWLERSQDRPIRTAARRYGVEPALIKAVVWQESRFNPSVRGHSGELGLMQLQEEAAREWVDAEHINAFDHEHCLDPATNILAGTYYLKKLLKRYRQTDNPIPYALADYNAGRGNVLKWLGGTAATNSAVFVEQIGFPATRQYVKAIMERYEYYRTGF